MKIAIAGDSAGKPLVDAIEAHLKGKGEHGVTNLSQSGFYADLSAGVAKAVKDGAYDRAILCCGTGIGVCISANKVPGIRAALTHDTYSAEQGRQIQQRPDHHHGGPRHRTRTRQGHRRYVARLRVRSQGRIRRQCRGGQPAGWHAGLSLRRRFAHRFQDDRHRQGARIDVTQAALAQRAGLAGGGDHAACRLDASFRSLCRACHCLDQ